MTVFPALAIVSQNSTMSGNWRGYRHIVKKDRGQHTPGEEEQLQLRQLHKLLLAGLVQAVPGSSGGAGHWAELLFVTPWQSLDFSS